MFILRPYKHSKDWFRWSSVQIWDFLKPSESSLVFLIPTKGLFISRWAGPVRRASSPMWDDFYPAFIWNFLSHCKKLVRHCKKIVLVTWEFLYFQYGFQKAAAISFYCMQYYEYDHCFFYSFASSWDFTYIVNESEKRKANNFKWNIVW